jgi:hemoglobin-like flavoprotein
VASVSPAELALIESADRVVRADPDAFARAFYATLFDVAPEVRELFDDDLTAQRGKLVDEVAFFIGAAADLDRFVERARELGRRHVGYGVRRDHYDAVGIALVAAVRERTGDEWTSDHHRAWTKMYRLISDVMLDGARSAQYADG